MIGSLRSQCVILRRTCWDARVFAKGFFAPDHSHTRLAALASHAGQAGAAAPGSPDVTAFIDASGDELILGGRPLPWWIEEFGLPLHISYAPDIRANLAAYKHVFERLYPKGEVRYAGKASTHPAVFRLAAEAGVGIDVASPYETRCALEAGVTPDKLDVNGNA